jgi:succinyl-CoA synthetase beta subunit
LVSPPEALVQTADEAVAAAKQIGYPLVLKACSPELLHKARLGLVRLDLRNEQELRLAFEQVTVAAGQAAPTSLEGFLVQPFLRGGIETIVGLSRDPQLGTLLLLGLGGAQVEAFELVTWRSCPIDSTEAETMVDDLPALGRLLAGRHGAPPADRPALVRALVQLSALGAALGERLESLEVNPLVVRAAGEGAMALDALAILA